MKCLEEVIVTLRLPGGGGSLDLELPAFMPVRELIPRLTEILRTVSPAFPAADGAGLSAGGRALSPEDTLAAAGVWDGGILEFSLHRELKGGMSE